MKRLRPTRNLVSTSEVYLRDGLAVHGHRLTPQRQESHRTIVENGHRGPRRLTLAFDMDIAVRARAESLLAREGKRLVQNGPGSALETIGGHGCLNSRGGK